MYMYIYVCICIYMYMYYYSSSSPPPPPPPLLLSTPSPVPSAPSSSSSSSSVLCHDWGACSHLQSNGHPQLLPDPSMRKRKPPSPDDGRPPRNRATPVELEAVLRAASSAPSAAAPSASSSSAHGADSSNNRPPSLAHGAENAEGVRTWLVQRRGSGRGARALQGTERLEHGGYKARVVFGAQIVEYENGLDYAARLSKSAYFEGYTAIPLGNAP